MIRGASWAAMILAVAHLLVTLVARILAPPPPGGPAEVSDGGPLTDLAIQFHRDRADLFLPVFRGILEALEATTTVHVVVGDEEDRALFEYALAGWEVQAAVEFAVAGHPITSWARDRLIVLGRPGGRPVLLAPGAPMTGAEARARDWTVPWTLAEHLGVPARRARYRFEGGDFAGDQDRVYVATPIFRRNPDTAADALLGALEADVGRPVLWLGDDGRPVPDHHIGMFVTPIGGGRVFYGDAELAASLLGGAARVEAGGGPLSPDWSAETLARFRNVGLRLREAGIDALPMPLLPTTTPFVWLSYDNVLMERRADGLLHVVMPVYGSPVLDAAATAAWEAAGAVVHPVDASTIFRLGGSVRCLVAPIGRSA